MFYPSFNESPYKDNVHQFVDAIRAHITYPPILSIVLGSGFADVLSDATIIEDINLATIPGYPRSTVAGHSSRLLVCDWFNKKVLVWRGRTHMYEGFSRDEVAMNTIVTHELGCKSIIYTNAAGGLNPRYDVGDVVTLTDLIDHQPRPTSPSSSIIDTAWHNAWVDHALQSGLQCHQGVYVSVLGPSYETRAEIKMYRRMGADVIGMSTVHEAKTANRLGMNVIALSLVTNVLHEVETPQLDHSHVVDVGNKSAEKLRTILKSAILTA